MPVLYGVIKYSVSVSTETQVLALYAFFKKSGLSASLREIKHVSGHMEGITNVKGLDLPCYDEMTQIECLK